MSEVYYEALREIYVAGLGGLLATIKVNTPTVDAFEVTLIKPNTLQVWQVKSTVTDLRPTKSDVPLEIFAVMLTEALQGSPTYRLECLVAPSPNFVLHIWASVDGNDSARLNVAQICMHQVLDAPATVTAVLRGVVIHMGDLSMRLREASSEAAKLDDAFRQRDDALRQKLVSERTMLRAFQKILNEKKRKLCEMEEERDRAIAALSPRGGQSLDGDLPEEDANEIASEGSKSREDNTASRDLKGTLPPRDSVDDLMRIGRQNTDC